MESYKRFFLRMLTIGLLGYTFSACFTSHTGGGGSSGTAIIREERIRIFAVANFDRLKEDMARGQGEHLTAFAMLLGIPQEQQAEFGAFTQKKFLVLFPSRQVTPEEMIAALTHELSSRPQIHSVVAMN